MRWTTTVLLVALMRCGSEETSSTVSVEGAPPPQVVVDAEPEHGGTVVAAGRYPVEVVAHRSGEVYAYALGDAPPPGEVEMTVSVPVRGRRTPRPVLMQWNPRESRYVGRVRSVEIEPGPCHVELAVGGVAYVGHAPVIIVAPAVEVIVVEQRGKWKGKHRGWGRGRGHGHGRGHGRVILVH
jgi:hypothetical protein